MATSDLPLQTLKVGTYTFTITEGEQSDIPEFCDVFDGAFANNLIFTTMSGTADRALLRKKDLEYWNKQWNMSGRRHFKVVDDATGYVIPGCLRLFYCASLRRFSSVIMTIVTVLGGKAYI